MLYVGVLYCSWELLRECSQGLAYVTTVSAARDNVSITPPASRESRTGLRGVAKNRWWEVAGSSLLRKKKRMDANPK